MSEDNLEVVSQEMMDELEEFCRDGSPFELFNRYHRSMLSFTYPQLANYLYKNTLSEQTQLKLIKHVWLNDPQFKAEKPKKWIVRSVNHDGENHYKYLIYSEDTDLPMYEIGYDFDPIVKFDTKEEAEKWTNPQTEAVEVEA